MKKIFSTILFSTFVCLCNAQFCIDTVHLHTPNGTRVIACLNEEYDPLEIEDDTNWFVQCYPQAELLAPTSRSYNCHSYAWNMTECGPVCWLAGDEDLYWEDGSYEETTEMYAQKAYSWYNYHFNYWTE